MNFFKRKSKIAKVAPDRAGLMGYPFTHKMITRVHRPGEETQTEISYFRVVRGDLPIYKRQARDFLREQGSTDINDFDIIKLSPVPEGDLRRYSE